MNISIQDTIMVCLSDMHSAGTTALFPPKFWQFEHGNHTPTKKQKEMWRHFDKCANIIAERRKGKRLIIINDGDAIDGNHHGTPQIVTGSTNEQIEIHQWLMDHFLQVVGFTKNKGDKLYYVKGTEIHVNDNENIIGKDLSAEMNKDLYAFDFLDITVNGKKLWVIHKGPGAGKGANKGNPMRNFLRNKYYDCISERIEPPHIIITAHVHDPVYEIFSRWRGDDLHLIHGIILPSWQQKTRFGYLVAPTERNKIGLSHFEITEKGDILQPKFELMKDKRKPVRV